MPADGHAVATTTSPSGRASDCQRPTHRSRARKSGSQSGPAPRRRRHAARSRPLAGTTSVTSWPRAARRSAYVRIARTPPTILRWGQRKVIFRRPGTPARARSPELLPLDRLAGKAPGDEHVADPVDHRLAARDVGDEAGHVLDAPADDLGEAARAVRPRSRRARHHGMVREPGIAARQRAELRVVREPARVAPP